MIKIIPTILAAALATTIATPVFAQAAIQEPGAAAFYHPNADVLAGRQVYRPLDSASARYDGPVPVQSRRSVLPRHHRAAR
jgi:hypothetical protein